MWSVMASIAPRQKRETKADFAQRERAREVRNEARREREFQEKSATTRFGRARELIGSVLGQFDRDEGGGTDGIDQSGLGEVERSIRASGKKRAGQAAGILAKRGIFTSGSSAAVESTIQAETEAAVAGKRGEFAESAADRRARKKAARLQAATQLTGQIAGGAFL